MPRATLLAALLLAAAVLSGCLSTTDDADASPTNPTPETPTTGGDDHASHAAQALTVSVEGPYPVNPAYSPATLTAVTGSMVKVTFSNNDKVPVMPHNWVLEGVEGAATETINPGASADAEFMAPASGEYKFFCAVGDHRERGMEGTLTVTAG